MTIKKARLSDLVKKKGESQKDFLEKLSDEELHKRALDDPDNPPLTEEEIKEFKPAKKETGNEKVKVRLSESIKCLGRTNYHLLKDSGEKPSASNEKSKQNENKKNFCLK
jgi:hypothetical protein